MKKYCVMLSLSLLSFLIAPFCHANWKVQPQSQSQTTVAIQVPSLYEQTLPLAKQGNSKAQYHVGMMLNNSIGGASKNPKEAFTWFQLAAEQGDALAQYKVGCYYAGQFAGVVEFDLDKALKYKLKAAQAGYDLAQSDVAGLYTKKEEWEQAIGWSKKAAEQGYTSAFLQTMMLATNPKNTQTDYSLAWAYGTLFVKDLERISASRSTSVNQKYENVMLEINKELLKFDEKLNEEEVVKAKLLVDNWKVQMQPISLEARRGISFVKELLNQNK
jgi:hypothetical protein